MQPPASAGTLQSAAPDDLFRLLISSIEDYAVFLLDEEGRVATWNAGAERLLGERAADAIGQPFERFFTAAEVAAGRPAELLRLAAGRGPLHDELWRARRDGSRVLARLALSAVRDAAGGLVGFAVVAHEPTDAPGAGGLLAEEKLRTSEERFRLLVESTHDYAIFMLDPDGRVTSWNPGAQRITGWAPGEIMGRHFSTFYLAEDVAADKPGRELREARVTGRIEDEGWRVRKDGTRYWSNVIITTLRAPDGSVRGFAKVTRDLTERKRNEERMAESERARGHAEEARERARRLADLSRALSATLDVGETAERVARLAVEWLADYCIVDLRGEDGEHALVAVAHVDPAKEPLVRRLRELLPPERLRDHPAGRAFATARTQVLERIDLAQAPRFDEPLASLLAELNATSSVVAPLVARGRVLGTISVVSCRPERRYGSEAVVVVEDLAQRAALALDNARLFEAERRARSLAEAVEQRLRAVLEQMPAGVLIVEAPTGRTLLANPQYEGLLGAAPRGIDEWPASACRADGSPFSPGERPLARALRGHAVEEEVRLVRADGSVVWLWVSAAPIRDAAGAVVAAIAAFVDLTERKRSERAMQLLAASGELLSTSLETEPTLGQLVRVVVPGFADWATIALRTDDGAIHTVALAHADPARVAWAERLQLEYPLDPDAPTGAPQVIRTGQSELYERVDEEVLRRAAVDAEQRRILEQLSIVSALVVPIRSRGRVVGALTLIGAESGHRYTAADVPVAEELARRAGLAIENAQLYAEARRAEREARQAVAVRDEFISIASHELRTPLTTLRIQSESLQRLLGREPPPPRERLASKVDSVLAQLDRLEALVQGLLDVSRLSLGRLQLAPEPLDAVEVTRAVVERFADQAAAVGTALTFEPAAPSLAGAWDRMRLDQVITNLVSNAIKYGGGQPVRVTLDGDDARVRLGVIDRGIGIAPEDQARIFERFERAVSDRNFAGLGLGLWITREIVHAMGGEIGVESEPGHGATFRVVLPRGRSTGGAA